jgi:hypothetical protein
VRTLIEDPAFTRQLEVLGDIRFADRILNGVTWGISTFAEEFEIVRGYQDLRIAKTDEFDTQDGAIVPLRLYFKIIDEDEVLLYWVERADRPGLLDGDSED